MSMFKIEHEGNATNVLPTFSVEIDQRDITAIYSDVDMHMALIEDIHQKKDLIVFDFEEGMYERLTVHDNIKFYRQWFHCQIPISELIVMFDLQACANKPLKKCSYSELRRLYYAKYYMMNSKWNIFYDPISSVNEKTINNFIQLIHRLIEEGRYVLLLVSSVEHAFLLTNITYHLRGNGLFQLNTESEEEKEESTPPVVSPVVEKLFKIPAKVNDKVILFDPTEIDYIESQDGKSFIYINKDDFALDLTLTEIEEKLELYGFYRCHRSYIVNLQKVREIITWSKNTYSLRINNKAQSTIPLSRTKLHDIKEIFKLK